MLRRLLIDCCSCTLYADDCKLSVMMTAVHQASVLATDDVKTWLSAALMPFARLEPPCRYGACCIAVCMSLADEYWLRLNAM